MTLFIGLQAFTNLAVAMGLLPNKGLALPFVSYGGSSLIVNAAAAGIILNVSRFGVSTPKEAQAAEKRTPLKPRLRTAGGGAG
jgi:cell division protein FtsW